MMLTGLQTIEGQVTKDVGKSTSSLIVKTSRVNLPEAIIYKNVKRNFTTSFTANPEIVLTTEGNVTDTVITIHYHWKGTVSSTAVNYNFTSLEIQKICAALLELESIDMTDAAVGTEYHFISPKRFMIRKEKTQTKVRYYMLISANGHESYLNFNQVYGIFKPIKEYLDTGIVPQPDIINNENNTTTGETIRRRSATDIARDRMKKAGSIMNKKIAP